MMKAARVARNFCVQFLGSTSYLRLTLCKFVHRVKVAQRRFRTFSTIQQNRKAMLHTCWKQIEHAVRRMMAVNIEDPFSVIKLNENMTLPDVISKLGKQRKKVVARKAYAHPDVLDVKMPSSRRETAIIKYLCYQRSVQGTAAKVAYERDYKAWLWSDHFIMNSNVSVDDIRG